MYSFWTLISQAVRMSRFTLGFLDPDIIKPSGMAPRLALKSWHDAALFKACMNQRKQFYSQAVIKAACIHDACKLPVKLTRHSASFVSSGRVARSTLLLSI